jgi:hypothetical protein
MITDRPAAQPTVGGKAEGGSAGPAAAGAQDLPPLPRCTDHPRRELELFCKLCEASMCSTCKETSHSECQKTWDEACSKKALPRSM